MPRDNRATPARDDRSRFGKYGSARTRTRTGEVGARSASRYTTDPRKRSGRPGSNGPLRGGAPVLFRLSYVRASTPGWSRTSAFCRRRTVLCPPSYGRVESLRQESNPHFSRTKGACSPLTLRRLVFPSHRFAARRALRAYRVAPAFLLGVRACGAPFPRCVVGRCRAKPGTAVNVERLSGDGRSRTDIFLVASEALVQLSYIPLCPSHRFAFLLGHAERVALGVASARGWCVAGHKPGDAANIPMRTGGVEPPQPEATGLQPAELADAQRPREVTDRVRTGTSGSTLPGAASYTTVTTKRGRRGSNPRPVA